MTVSRSADLAPLLPWFRRAGPDFAAMAAEITAQPEHTARVLKHARSELLRRLHCRSDDFAATEALRALDTYSAHLGPAGHSGDPERLVHGGLSGTARMRAWRPWRSAAVKPKKR
jgi:hypothetical protein